MADDFLSEDSVEEKLVPRVDETGQEASWTDLAEALDEYLKLDQLDKAEEVAALLTKNTTLDPAYLSFIYVRLFAILFKQGKNRQAVDVFLEHQQRLPDTNPIAAAWQVWACAEAAGVELPLPYRLPVGRPPLDAEFITVTPYTLSPRFEFPVIGSNVVPPFLRLPQQEYHRTAIDVIRIRNGRILVEDGTFAAVDVEDYACFRASNSEFPAVFAQRIRRQIAHQPVKVVEAETAIVISDKFWMGGNLCHALLDHVTRLHLYEKAGVDLSKSLVIGAVRKYSFEYEIYQALGIQNYVEVSGCFEVRANDVYVSTNCRDLHHAADHGGSWALDYLRTAFPSRLGAVPKRIYISRRRAAGRRIHNETEVEALLLSYGFETVIAEELSFAEQVHVFSAATHVVAPHGAGLTNCAFVPYGAHILEIFHPQYGTGSYTVLAREGGWRYTAMIGRDWEGDLPQFNTILDTEIIGAGLGMRDIRVDLTVLENWLKEVAL